MTLKKFLALALSAMMILSCMIVVNAANELPTVSDMGYTLPEPWVEVYSNNFDMITYYDAEGNDVTADIEAVTTNDTVVGEVWKVFKDGDEEGNPVGHLRGPNCHAVDTNGAGATVEFTFTGTAVALLTQFTNMKASSPTVEAYIDGELVETLDPNVYGVDAFDGSHVQCRVHFQKTDLAEGTHTLKLVATTGGDLGVNSFAYIPCEAPNETPAPETPSTSTVDVLTYKAAGVRYVKLPLEAFDIAAGQTFCYDVMIDADVAGLGALNLDGQHGDMRDVVETGVGLKDQNGVATHPKTDLSDKALNTWYTRTIALDAYAGTIDCLLIAAEATGEGTASFKNICVKNADGTVAWSLDVSKAAIEGYAFDDTYAGDAAYTVAHGTVEVKAPATGDVTLAAVALAAAASLGAVLVIGKKRA